MTYNPLEAAGPEAYPAQVGSMLLTLVEPHKGYERAFNRWYERDHYYGGCMEGPWTIAGARWVATRELKDLRWPRETDVAEPYNAGSFVAIYWVLGGHHDEWGAWSTPQVRNLYAGGRGFAERTHVNTNLYNFLGADYRDADPVPVTLALDHRYAGLVITWFDGLGGRSPQQCLAELRKGPLREFLAGSQVEIAATFAPILPPADRPPPQVPMKLGAGPGGPNRFCQLLFTDADPKVSLDRLRGYERAAREAGIAELRLAAPFVKTVVGTDTYVDQL
jgi:hypothetical protein